MGMMFAGSKFCPHCGASARQITQGEAAKHKCPRCRTPLAAVSVGNTPLEECMHCGGLWVDVSRFDHICSDAEAQTAATGLKLPPPAPIDTHVRYLNCPQCANLMNRMNYAGRSGIVICVCRPHGIWLDRDEMRQIIEFIRAGGVDRARSIEKEKLSQERRALEAQSRVPNYNIEAPSSSFMTPQNNAVDYAELGVGIASLIGHLFIK
jgi:Zn-finger nucleic acid-binding protein